MRVRCNHCIKIRSREAPQDSKSKDHDRDCMLDCSGHRDQSQVTRHPKDEKQKNREVKHDARTFMDMMMGVRCVYRIKNSKQGGATGPEVASTIMVACWTPEAVMVLNKGKQKIRWSNKTKKKGRSLA